MMNRMMNKKTIVSILLLSILVRSSYADDLRVAADSWCPFTCSPQLGMNGVLIDVLTEAFSGVGTRISYTNTSWPKAIEGARQGKFHAVVGAIRGEAPDFVFHEVPLGEQRPCFYALRPMPSAAVDLKSLPRFRIGAVQGKKYGEPYDTRLGQKGESSPKEVRWVSGTETTLELLRLLKSKEVDLILEDEAIFDFLATLPNKPLQGYTFNKVKCLNRLPVFVAFSPKREDSAKLAKILDARLKELDGSKKLRRIREKYQ